jgi:hypothetical protein
MRKQRILAVMAAVVVVLTQLAGPPASATTASCPSGSTVIANGPGYPGGPVYNGCRKIGQHWIAQEGSGTYYYNYYLVWGNMSGTLNQRIVVGSDWGLYAASCFQEHCDPWESLGGAANAHGGGIFFTPTSYDYGRPFPTGGYLRVYGTDGQYYCNHGESGYFQGWRVDHGGTCA